MIDQKKMKSSIKNSLWFLFVFDLWTICGAKLWTSRRNFFAYSSDSTPEKSGRGMGGKLRLRLKFKVLHEKFQFWGDVVDLIPKSSLKKYYSEPQKDLLPSWRKLPSPFGLFCVAQKSFEWNIMRLFGPLEYPQEVENEVDFKFFFRSESLNF